ncbi:hypothetical protein GPA10_37760 [Streptomyces sp. p1417]|uniref:Uncharacterized protein n=1 Tax=Streptomyces typhae TaxID=2681492 RepID=A0A6L6X8U0_9ACTN|nr:hypothetical protein [Streptomyces typhae]MVO90345.1 hypothetical protein [Streptomyces typhae]
MNSTHPESFVFSCLPAPPALDAPQVAGSRRLEYDAFCELALMPYLRFARVRLGDFFLALQVVHSTFVDLAKEWDRALNGPSAPAAAWELLQATMDRCRPSAPRRPTALSGPHDMIVLHCVLGCSIRSIAHLRGLETSEIAARLAFARRSARPTSPCRARHACLPTF